MNIQKEKETPQTRKAIIMKKNTISALYAYFVKNDTTTDLSAAIEDIRAEYEKSAEKVNAKMIAYEQAKPIVLAAITGVALTVKDIFTTCENDLPVGFTASKIQYALLHYWNDEVVKIDNGKSPFTYQVKWA